MLYNIHKTAVLGGGTEGAEIAIHIANVGIPCILLQEIPSALSEEDKKKGLTKENPKWRNKISETALLSCQKAKPSPFYTKKNVSLIQLGNFEDNLKLLSEIDWVIDVSSGNLQSKKDLLARIHPYLQSECILSSADPGIAVQNLAVGLPSSLRERFLGIHFPRPIRTTPLFEILPIKETRDATISLLTYFAKNVLGKNVIVCHGTPGFTNRMGIFDLCNAIQIAVEMRLSIAQMDEIGRALGRPDTGFFGTLDTQGIDSMMKLIKNVYEKLQGDEWRNSFILPAFIDEMLKHKWLGKTTHKGFYIKSEGTTYYLDYNKMEYVQLTEKHLEDIQITKCINRNIPDILREYFNDSGIVGEVVRKFLCRYFLYAVDQIPEICSDIEIVDKALRWGYGHALGPFETWDTVGVAAAVERMKEYGWDIPVKIETLMKQGNKTFYKRKDDSLFQYNFDKRAYIPTDRIHEANYIFSIKKKSKTVRNTTTACLNDLGDGIALLELHERTITDDTMRFIMESCDEIERNFIGMLIGSQSSFFSAGIDIETIIAGMNSKDWDSMAELIIRLQTLNMRLKYLDKPVVVMPAGKTVMGGCELAMHSAACQPLAEVQMGLSEARLGLIPLGGGCKELMVRLTEDLPYGIVERGLNLQYFYLKIFENLTAAKVSTSAAEAVELGYLKRTDPISLNPYQHLWDAKQLVEGIAKYYRPPKPSMVPVMGEAFRGLVESNLLNMRMGGFVSEYDSHIASRIASILSGGDCPNGTLIMEEEILALEREAILGLCGEKKTQERITHFFNTGRFLRN